MPNLAAIEVIAAHCDSYSRSCSKTIRTARSRTSAGYRPRLAISTILSSREVSKKPGAVQLISAEKARTPISMACRLLGVSRSGYYEWAVNVPSARAREDAELAERIVQIHGANRGVYGSPRIHADWRWRTAFASVENASSA